MRRTQIQSYGAATGCTETAYFRAQSSFIGVTPPFLTCLVVKSLTARGPKVCVEMLRRSVSFATSQQFRTVRAQLRNPINEREQLGERDQVSSSADARIHATVYSTMSRKSATRTFSLGAWMLESGRQTPAGETTGIPKVRATGYMGPVPIII